VQRRRDKAAAVKLMRKLLKRQGFAPDVLVTDKLRSYGADFSPVDAGGSYCAMEVDLRGYASLFGSGEIRFVSVRAYGRSD
jgi:transposase-like protein